MANDGNGSISVTLGEDKVTFDLKPKVKRDGATFDRFGLLSIPPGGSLVRLYLDDLKYTSSRKGGS
jgi:hypothetical protein